MKKKNGDILPKEWFDLVDELIDDYGYTYDEAEQTANEEFGFIKPFSFLSSSDYLSSDY